MDEILHYLYIAYQTVVYFAALGLAGLIVVALCVRDEDLVLLQNQSPDEDDVFESDRDDGYDDTGNPVGRTLHGQRGQQETQETDRRRAQVSRRIVCRGAREGMARVRQQDDG